MHSSKLGPQAAGRGSAGGHRFMVSLCVILYHVLVVSHVLLPAAERHTTNSSSLLSMSMPTTATTTTTSTTTTTRAPAGRQLNKQQQQQQDESMQINAKTNTTILKNTEWPSELPSRRGLFALQTRQRAQQQQQQQPLEVVAELARRVPVGAIGGAQLAAPLNHSTSQQQQQHSSAARQLTGTLPVTSSPATKVNGASRASASAVGANNNSSSSLNNYHQYRLPSWFNYYAFKRLYGKEYGSRFANELHKRIYLETALKVFEQRALYRLGRIDALASVSELSDLTGEQLDDFRRWRRRDEASSPSSQKPAMMATANNKTRSRPSTSASSRSTTSTTKMPASERHGGGGGQLPRRLPECCTYDQVYARIIEMLSSATSSNDTALSRALVDELEQRPLVEEAAAGQVNDSTTANQMVSVGSFRADAQAASPLGQSSLVGQLRGGGGAQRVVMLTNGTTTGEAEMETYNNRQGRSRSGGMVIGSEKPPGRSERLEEAANENRLWPPDQHNNDKNKNNNYNNWNMEAAKLALDSQIETIRSGALGKSAGGQVVRQLTRPGGSIGGGPSASGNGGTDSMHEGKQKTNYQSQTNKPAVATTTTNTTRTTPEEAATTITIAQQATNLDASNPNTGRGPNRGSGGDKRRMLVPAANRMIERPEDEEEEEASWEEWAETSYGGGPKTGARSPLEPVPELTDGLRRTIAGIPADNAAGLYESSRGGSTRAKRPPLSMLGPGGDLAAVAADDDERRNWLARKSATTTTASNILRLDVNRLREPNGAGGGGPTQNKSTTFARNSNGQTMTTMTKSDELEQAGLPRELEEAVRAQLAEQLSSSSPLGRELTKQLSAYFGKPVEIRAVRPVGVPTTTTTTTTTKKPATAASWSRGRGSQQQS